MTLKQIKNIAKKEGIDLSLISIHKRFGEWHIEMCDLPKDLSSRNIAYYDQNRQQLPEVEKMIRKYNREAKKLMKALNTPHWGLKTGYGEWIYKTGSMDESTRLALNNID